MSSVSCPVHPDALQKLREAGHTVEVLDPVNEQTIAASIPNAEGDHRPRHADQPRLPGACAEAADLRRPRRGL
jgi:hypothetical protein